MLFKDEIKRTTFTYDRKYFIKASAAWVTPVVGNSRIVITAEVFAAPPLPFTNQGIFLYVADACTADLLDALQAGEAAARRYIESLPRPIG